MRKYNNVKIKTQWRNLLEESRNFVVKTRIAVNFHVQLKMFNETLRIPRTVGEVNGHLHTMKEGTRGYYRL